VGNSDFPIFALLIFLAAAVLEVGGVAPTTWAGVGIFDYTGSGTINLTDYSDFNANYGTTWSGSNFTPTI
jgi:hypothetical protein